MKRRDFLKKGILITALGALYAGTIGRLTSLMAQRPAPARAYDLVAVRGGDSVTMYRRAIREMGGMQKYVKRGQRVVIKPNMAWDVTPERGANTNPQLVGAIVEDCIAAGASRVFVFDHTVDQWQRAYATSGIEQAAREAGALVVPGNLERDYQEVQIPGARRLRNARVHQQIIEADVFINVPILKHHGSTTVTIAMKNLMGIVWDRRFWHINDLHQCIADFCLYRKPDLNIVDGYLVMTRNGPRGVSTADLSLMKSLIISPDIVAADAASTLIFGEQPRNIGHIRIGAEMGIGQMNLEALNIKRVAI